VGELGAPVIGVVVFLVGLEQAFKKIVNIPVRIIREKAELIEEHSLIRKDLGE
jgi:hypothetical protein